MITLIYPRFISQKIETALEDTPVVMIAGPRQCGKSTLVKNIVTKEWGYITFDDTIQLDAAKKDPIGFIRYLGSKNTIIDEIQRAPELFVCIKQSVDELRKPGRFLLTGSCNAMLLPQLSDSLAGRIEVIPLMPLSECEIRSKKGGFLTKILNKIPPSASETRIRKLLIDKIVAGGFPEPLSRKNPQRRFDWYKQFINSLIQRDVKDIADIENINLIPRLLKALSNQIGQITNIAAIAEKISLSPNTTARYCALLSQLFLIDSLPAWHRNENKRLVKSPKMHFVDTGLVCALRSITKTKMENSLATLYGHLLENYVYCELKKQSSWLDEPIEFFHYRDKDKVEVDIVLETPEGKIIGIEVKGSATLNRDDFQGLNRLRESFKQDFLMGILMYDGDHTTPYGDDIYAVPIGALWDE